MNSICVLLYFGIFLNSVMAHSTWSSGYMNARNPNRVVEFIYHTTELSWEEARTICQENGGDLATIENFTLVEHLVHYANVINEDIFLHKDYWVGMFYDGVTESFLWVFDCTTLQNSVEFDLALTGGKWCFMRHAGTPQSGAGDKCFRKKPFLCQKYTSTPCKVDGVYKPIISKIIPTISYDSCRATCIADDFCSDIIFIANSTCYILNTTESDGVEVTVASKYCIKVSVNETVVTSTDTTENTCGALPTIESYASFLTQSPVFSVMPTSPWLQLSPSVTVTAANTISTHWAFSHDFSSPTPSISPSACTVTLTVSTSVLVFSEPEPVHVSSANMVDPEEIAQAIVKNLTINMKETSAYTRKLSSASDSRQTSTVMGCLGLACVILPLAFIVLSDLKLIYFQICKNALAPSSKETSFRMRRIKVN